MNIREERARCIAVCLYPEDWRDIEAVTRRSGASSRSGGLRALIQEWRALTATMTHLTYIPTGVAEALQEGRIKVMSTDTMEATGE